MNTFALHEIHMLPVQQINVVSGRDGKETSNDSIIDNIRVVSLTRPIVVAPRKARNGQDQYLLLYGECRLNAFKALGEEFIPVLISHISDEDAFFLNLAESIARRLPPLLALIGDVFALRARGYH